MCFEPIGRTERFKSPLDSAWFKTLFFAAIYP
jgi:hypothetical protein